MNANNKDYRLEVHTAGSLRMLGGQTMMSWGAHCTPSYYTKAQVWALAKEEMAKNPAALVKVYVHSRLVWSNRPCAY